MGFEDPIKNVGGDSIIESLEFAKDSQEEIDFLEADLLVEEGIEDLDSTLEDDLICVSLLDDKIHHLLVDDLKFLNLFLVLSFCKVVKFFIKLEDIYKEVKEG